MDSNNSKISSWQQTRMYTCGAAALMTALNELNGYQMSEKEEIRIWWKIHPFYYLGSMPGLVGIFAKKQGLNVEIHYSPDNIKNLLKQLPFINRLMYKILLLMNRMYFFRASLRGICSKKHDGYCDDISLIKDNLSSKKGCRILSVIQVEDWEVHYVLFRLNSAGEIVVMDPATGRNYDLEDALDRGSEYRFTGIHIVLNS